MIAREAGTPTRLVRSNPLFDRPPLFPNLRNTETSTDLLGQIVWNLCVPWHSLAFAVRRTDPKGVGSTFALQKATMAPEVTE